MSLDNIRNLRGWRHVVRNKRGKIKHTSSKDIISEEKLKNIFKRLDYSSGNFFTQNSIWNIIQICFNANKDDIRELSFYRCALINLFNIFKLEINKNYGKSTTNNLLVVPYSGVNTPLEQSKFSNIYITIILTFNMYLNEGLDDKCISEFISSYKQTLNIYFYTGVTEEIENKNILKGYISINEIILFSKDQILDRLRPFYKNIGLISTYINYYLVNKFDYDEKFKSTTFLNIISPFYSKYKKKAFSGSVNFNIPNFKQINDNHRVIYGEDIEDYVYFDEILLDDTSNRDVKNAIEGSVLETNIYSNVDVTNLSIIKEKLDTFENLTEYQIKLLTLMFNQGITVLIDCRKIF